MPRIAFPNSDPSRLGFFRKTLATGPQDIAANIHYLDAAFLAQINTLYSDYNTAYEKLATALGDRVREVAESSAVYERLKKYCAHMMDSMYNRVDRLGLDSGLLIRYRMTQDGTRPRLSTQEEQVRLAQDLIRGDAEAVAAGYAPVQEPSAAELQAVLTAFLQEQADVVQADRAYDVYQANVDSYRAAADATIQEVVDRVTFGTRAMDRPSQRRVLRSYGARYYYLASEPRDEDDPGDPPPTE